jgi:hypothetical protein
MDDEEKFGKVLRRLGARLSAVTARRSPLPVEEGSGGAFVLPGVLEVSLDVLKLGLQRLADSPVAVLAEEDECFPPRLLVAG